MGIKIDIKLKIIFCLGLLFLNQAHGQGYPGTKRGDQSKAKIEYPPLQASGTQGLTTPLGQVPVTINSCYVNNQYWPSVRLPNSLDNLIFIVEKIEDYFYGRNISINASFVASIILRRFQVNGIYDVKDQDAKNVDKNEQYKQDIIFRLFQNMTFAFPDGILDPREQCALHWMVSTSMNTTNLDPYNTAPIYDPTTQTYTIVDYPRENGAIYSGKYGSISGGPLLSGIAASSNLYTIKVQDMLSPDQWTSIDPSILATQVDPISVASLAGEIGQSVLLFAFPQYTHAVFGPDASWNGTVCSTTFISYEKIVTAATKAELLGATDGLIIGNYLKSNYYGVGAAVIPSLSQVLRSYYGRGLSLNSYHACDRSTLINQVMNSLQTSATGFAVVYSAKGGTGGAAHQFPDDVTLSNYISSAISNYTQTYLQSQEFACDSSVQSSLCQTLNDIIVVMDTSPTASYDGTYQDQKDFIGSLIQRIGVFPNNSHVGVITFGTESEPVPFDAARSGGDVRCQLQWAQLYSSSTDVPKAIKRVQEKFRTIRNIQKTGNYPQVPGKVVIFIYLQSNMPNTDQVTSAMRELRREFPELTSLAVGKTKNVLQNLVVDKDRDVFDKVGEQLSYNVQPIVTRLCTAPASIEYKNCRYPEDSEDELVATNFVYQDTYQWLSIYPMTMNLSENLYLNLESQYGSARWCVSRSITTDPSGLTSCYETSPTTPIHRYGPNNPCDSYDVSCPPIYIAVRGKTGGSTDQCSERACDSLNQVKVTVTHEGFKCGGINTTASLQTMLFALLIILYFKLVNIN